jgi:hypothetical protein
MRQLLPGRYNLSDATFSRASMAYDDVGRLAGLAVPMIAKTPYGKMAMVEEGTANLVPVDKQKFEGWTAYSGAVVTLTQNQSVPEWGCTDATRIQVSGGTSTYKYLLGLGFTSVSGQSYTNSIHIKNIGSAPVRIGANFPYTATVAPGETKKVILINIGDGVAIYRFDFYSVNASDSLDFIAWHPMAETKPYPTSFVPTSRAAESLTMPVLATNLLTTNQADIESGMSGIAISGTGVITATRDTSEYYHGTACLKVVTDGSASLQGAALTSVTVAANQVYTASIWIKGSGNLQIALAERDSSDVWIAESQYDFVATSTWQRVSVTRSFGSTGVKAKIYIRTNSTAQAITLYADCFQLEIGPYPTTWNLPTGATTPRMGLPVEHGTIEGIVEITDNSKKQISGYAPYILNINGAVTQAIVLSHRQDSANWSLITFNDASEYSRVFIADSLTPNGLYYYKIPWTTSEAQIEFWNLDSRTKVASETIANPYLPTSFGSKIQVGSYDGSTANYFSDAPFGRHRSSNIARTDDPDFNNLMPQDGNTVGIFDPTYSFLT